MLSSCKSCWISLSNRAQMLFNVNRCKRRSKRRRLSSSFDLETSSFAALEISGQFKQVFKVMDANGDGKISPLELSELLLCLGHEKSTASEAAEGMVREMDFDGDGYIDLDEFMHAVVNDTGDDGATNGGEDYLMDAFLIFDSDKNGLISAKELRNVLNSLGFNKCSLQQCMRMIRGVDKDGDGFVDFKEFRSMMKAAECTS
ncbi:probable calcium-binding protein CML23 [Hibiscus syriacus]|uniref:probable calcium-binding protein CML23 n=1 Tax=Hibiscus syriacus TaxID=106335 RepID=UPI001924D8F9|nr:probable calcium-binding protein CML23 [Hibiscus syriacus]